MDSQFKKRVRATQGLYAPHSTDHPRPNPALTSPRARVASSGTGLRNNTPSSRVPTPVGRVTAIPTNRARPRATPSTGASTNSNQNIVNNSSSSSANINNNNNNNNNTSNSNIIGTNTSTNSNNNIVANTQSGIAHGTSNANQRASNSNNPSMSSGTLGSHTVKERASALFGGHNAPNMASVNSPAARAVGSSVLMTRRSSGAGIPVGSSGFTSPSRLSRDKPSTPTPKRQAVAVNNYDMNKIDSTASTSNLMAIESQAAARAAAQVSTPDRSHTAREQSANMDSIMKSPGLLSPTKKRVFDRYIPTREGGLSELYDLLPEAPSTPSKNRTRKLNMSGGSDSQNKTTGESGTHDAILANELMLSNPHTQYEADAPSTPRRLFAYASTTTHNTVHFDSPSRQRYAATPVSYDSRKILLSPKRMLRNIAKVPFKVLDAPDLQDDFYLNLVDWSSKNTLGVGLGSCVYLWSAVNSKVTQLCDLGNDSVTSINWMARGSHLAVGTNSGTVQIWDVDTSKKVRTMTGHTNRVGVLAWNDHILTSGSRDRNIYNRDVRAQDMWQQLYEGHRAEVCGLKWNSGGTQLASGGNDNKLYIWEKESNQHVFKFSDHTAAVKAIDWNPHMPGLLASGGGTQDRHIRFWNTITGTAVSATDTESQVCNLVWSKTTNELVSTHGYSQNQIVVWKYPTMEKIASLSGHTYRVLYLALSPDGQTIVTGAGDETLRFWNVFQKGKIERREEVPLWSVPTTIR